MKGLIFAQWKLLDFYWGRTSPCVCVWETQLGLSAAVSFTCRGRISGTPTLPSASLGCISIPRESVSSFLFFLSLSSPSLFSHRNAQTHLMPSAIATAHSHVPHECSSPYLMILCIHFWLWLQVHFGSTSWNRCGSVHSLFTSIQCKVFIQDELIVAFYVFPLHQSLSSSTKTPSLCVSETFHWVLILPVFISPEVVLAKPFHRGKVMRCLLTCDLHCYRCIVPRVSLQTVI